MFKLIRDSLDNSIIILRYAKFNVLKLHTSMVDVQKVLKAIKNTFITPSEYYAWKRSIEPKTIKELIKAHLQRCSSFNREHEEDVRIMLLASLPIRGELTHWTIQLMRNI